MLTQGIGCRQPEQPTAITAPITRNSHQPILFSSYLDALPLTAGNDILYSYMVTNPKVGMIMLISLIARKTSAMLATGRHICSIVNIEPAVSVREMPWSDKTPQLMTTFKSTVSGTSIKAWYNTLGYVEYKELSAKEQQSGKFVSMQDPTFGGKSYAVDKKTNCRLIDAIFEVNGKQVAARTLEQYNSHVQEGHELVGGNTLDALNIISALALDSGIEAGEGFDESDLIGRTVGIKVEDNKNGNARVVASFAPHAVSAGTEVAS